MRRDIDEIGREMACHSTDRHELSLAHRSGGAISQFPAVSVLIRTELRGNDLQARACYADRRIPGPNSS